MVDSTKEAGKETYVMGKVLKGTQTETLILETLKWEKLMGKEYILG